MIRFRTLWAAALTGCLALTACANPEPPPSPEVEVPVPLPDGIDFDPDIGSDPADTGCDPLASYEPDSIGAAEAREQLDDPDRVVVGISQSTNLMGYRDPVSGDLSGFDVDIAKELVERLVGSADDVQWVPMTSGEREEAVNSGRVDMVVRTMTMNCSRWEEVEFSTEYYHAGQRLLVASDSGIEGLQDLTGDHLVCTGAGSTSPRNIADDSEAQPVTVPDFNDCLVLLQQGVVDAITTDDTILAGMAIQDPTLEVVGEAFSEEPYGVAFAKGDTDLARFVNGALEDMIDDGTWQEIYDRWLAPHLGAEPPDLQTKYQDE
ncbi:glutamate ABC transporter substrate-binding protein [Glycomyces xiaoerkulensis]|uniref:glutamate ABC transporter substrate-binding protein n=1 Tax=Glycomyces xiaoerkulensis TaxID=2038139 RepID=UPI000C26A8BA|nr:glutamate ABC transporter substrate-binding protein [Glycomyces xiaoerkulensis]